MINTSELAHGLSELVAEWQSLKTACEDYAIQLSDAREEIQDLERTPNETSGQPKDVTFSGTVRVSRYDRRRN